MSRVKLIYRIFSPQGALRGRVHYLEDAAALVALYSKGATIRTTVKGKSRVLWTQGVDGEAGNSYDSVAVVAHLRKNAPNVL